MNIKIGQHMIFPQEEAAELLALCGNQGVAGDRTNATKLAQKMADEDSDSYLVVEVVRIVNPLTLRRNEDLD